MTDLPEPAVPAEPQEWYCDQCGARYPSAGLCDNQHPPAELKPLDAVAQADDGSQAAVEPESPAEATGEPAGDTSEAATAAPPETVQTAAATGPLQDARAALEAAYGALKTAIDNLNEHLTQQG